MTVVLQVAKTDATNDQSAGIYPWVVTGVSTQNTLLSLDLSRLLSLSIAYKKIYGKLKLA